MRDPVNEMECQLTKMRRQIDCIAYLMVFALVVTIGIAFKVYWLT